jgi:penicillin-binding protein 1A
MLLSNERTISRKVKEMILAERLEKHLTKDEILHIYLNQIYFGNKRYGIEEASQFYFGHGVKDLTLGEAAMLASTPKSPNEINPIANPSRLKERQTYVLHRMAELGFISSAVAEREIARPIPQPPKRLELSGEYYVDEVKRQLLTKFDEKTLDNGGLRIETMMNPTLQAAAEASMKMGLRELDKRQGWRGALGRIDEAAWKKLKEEALNRLATGDDEATESYGPVPVLDLRRVDSKSLADDRVADRITKAARAAQWKRGAPGVELVSRIDAVTKSDATLDLGGATATLTLTSVSWARRYNPASMTAQPKTMSDVVKPGDLVKVHISKVTPCEDAEKKKDSCKEPKVELSLEQDPEVEGALVSIDPTTRGVVALVGGYDFDARRNAFNRATQAKRQPGSAFKPFVYATALEVGQQRAQFQADPNHAPLKASCLIFTPRQQVNDAPEYIPDHWTGKPWIPQNFERNSFEGPMSLRRALAASKNTVAVKLIEQIGCEPSEAREFADLQSQGLSRVKNLAQRAGIDSPIPDSITAALGSGEVTPIELTNAYATFAANGQYTQPVLIKRVLGTDGKVLWAPTPPSDAKPRGLSPEVAFVTASMMRSVVEDSEGTARSLQKLGRPIAGKTGTASEQRDAWFVGFTPEVVTGVWVGFDDHGMMGGRETGGHAAGPIWLSYMRVAEDKIEHRDFDMPSGVVAVDIDPRTGLLADPKSPYLEREVYLPGTEPKELSQPDVLKPEDFMRGEVP